MSQSQLREGLSIQFEVIKALIQREMITRWGRKNIGFLWVVVEPLAIIFAISAAISIFRLYRTAAIYRLFNVDVIAFALLAYSTAFLWRRPPMMCASSVNANAGLLLHRNVKLFDLFMARFFLEMIGVTCSFLILLVGCIAFDLIAVPVSFELMIAAWLLMIWLAFGVCYVIGSLIIINHGFLIVWMGVSILVYMISGTIFMVDWLPVKYQSLVLWNPIVHGMEMMRHGYYGDAVKTYENPLYLIGWDLALMLLGLWTVRSNRILRPES